jgi:hypothetical protein
MKEIDYKEEKKIIASFESDYLELEKLVDSKQIILEFKQGDRTWVGAGNYAEKIGVNKEAFRSYFKKIKDKLFAQDYPVGYAIALAYTISKKHFKKLKKKMKG